MEYPSRVSPVKGAVTTRLCYNILWPAFGRLGCSPESCACIDHGAPITSAAKAYTSAASSMTFSVGFPAP